VTSLLGSEYCRLLAQENGIQVLENLIKNTGTPQYITKLANITKYQYQMFQESGNLGGLEDSEDIDITSIIESINMLGNSND